MAGEVTYTFGAAAVTGKADWLVQSANHAKGAQEAMALNNVGEPVTVHYYQKTDEISLEVVIPAADSTIPAIGDTFAYNGQNYYVSGVTVAESNTDFVRYTISGKRFTTANLPANS